MKRGLSAIAAGIVFLILVIWPGTIITTVIPHCTTTQAGSYYVTLQVNPIHHRLIDPPLFRYRC